MIEELKNIRNNPRKMQMKYLKNQDGILDFINNFVPDNTFSIKDKIDIIINNHTTKCICGKLTKYNKEYCSVDCVNKASKVRDKISDANIKNATTRIRKSKHTLLKRYGVTSVQDIPQVKLKTKMKKLEYYDSLFRDTFKKYDLNYDQYNNKEYIENICKDIAYPSLSKKYFNGMPIMTIFRFIRRLGANVEFRKASSAGERHISKWIEGLGFNVESNTRSIIKPKELDIYVPEKKLAIEFNGLYFHRDNEKTAKEKLNLCRAKNISLLQIFEDEWYFKEEIVKSIIKSKLGIISNKIHARNTVFTAVSPKIAKGFLDENHIQGFINGKHFGLYFKDELVSIMTIGKCRYYDGIELLRFANKIDLTVVGGFSKLLKNVKSNLKIEKMKTYADLRYSNGDLYKKFGTLIKETKPGFFWTTSNSIERISRYKTQKHKLEKFLKNKYDVNLTENENMISAGFHKIYDSGNLLFEI